MKLNFDPEIQKVIDIIAALPNNTGDLDTAMQPMRVINAFNTTIDKQKETKELPEKQYVKLRRQLSFIYEFVRIAQSAEIMATAVIEMQKEGIAVIKDLSTVTPARKKAEELSQVYWTLVKIFKQIKSGKALEELPVVRIAMRYGVLRLSDHEIQGLIDRNKV